MMIITTKVAVAQFEAADDPAIMQLASEIGKLGVHWYIFDKTANREFEIKDLKEHYDIVLEVSEL